MYLHNWVSISEAAEWLTHTWGEQWTWRRVIHEFAITQPQIISVVIPPNTPLITTGTGDAKPIMLRLPLQCTVPYVWEFLQHIEMGDDVHAASAYPRFLVAGTERFISELPIRATALRLSEFQVRALAPTPLQTLMQQMKAGKHPELAVLAGYMTDFERGKHMLEERVAEFSGVKLNNKLRGKKEPHRLRKCVLRRSIPSSGDPLTKLILDTCFTLTEETGFLRPSAVMASLINLANTTPVTSPLVGTCSGSIKYENGAGEQRELTDVNLRERTRNWRKSNGLVFSRAGYFIRQD